MTIASKLSELSDDVVDLERRLANMEHIVATLVTNLRREDCDRPALLKWFDALPRAIKGDQYPSPAAAAAIKSFVRAHNARIGA